MSINIDWGAVATVAAPLIALLVGEILDRIIRPRAKLISFVRHVSGITLNSVNPPLVVNSHSIVIVNQGEKVANDIRVGLNKLTDFNIYPDTLWTVNKLPAGTWEIVIPKMVPKKELTITYLYFPPITWDQIHTHVEYEDGPVKVVNVVPMIPLPKWKLLVIKFLIGTGVLTITYLLYLVAKFI